MDFVQFDLFRGNRRTIHLLLYVEQREKMVEVTGVIRCVKSLSNAKRSEGV